MNVIEQLQSKLNGLRDQFATIGTMRPGTLARYHRKCGKPNCRCADPDHPGHPGWQLTSTIGSKPRCRGIPASALEQTQAQLSEYVRFQQLVTEFTNLSEQLCDQQLKALRNEKKTSTAKRRMPRSALHSHATRQQK